MRESDCGACAVESQCHIKRRALWTVTSTCAEIANWVRCVIGKKKPFCKKSCAPLYRNFYRNFFRFGGPQSPPPPSPVSYFEFARPCAVSNVRVFEDADSKSNMCTAMHLGGWWGSGVPATDIVTDVMAKGGQRSKGNGSVAFCRGSEQTAEGLTSESSSSRAPSRPEQGRRGRQLSPGKLSVQCPTAPVNLLGIQSKNSPRRTSHSGPSTSSSSTSLNKPMSPGFQLLDLGPEGEMVCWEEAWSGSGSDPNQVSGMRARTLASAVREITSQIENDINDNNTPTRGLQPMGAAKGLKPSRKLRYVPAGRQNARHQPPKS